MTSLLELARPAIVKMAAYKSARSLATKGEVFLDANESPWAVSAEAVGTNRYPEPQPAALVAKLAALYGATPAQTFVGRGADEAIDCLVRTFCEAEKDGVLFCPPTYGVYATAAAIQGAFVVEVVRREAAGFAADPKAILAAMRPGVKLVFLCSPNNPTGNVEPASTVETLCRELSGRALVVVDEAYGEFSKSTSATALLGRFPNLVVLRTLSKAFALAGVRCGTALAHRDVISLLQKVRAPYPMSAPTIRAALAGLSDDAVAACRTRVATLNAERARLASALGATETVFPSEGNFLLVRFRDPKAVLAACAERGIVLRDRGDEPGLSRCIRITVGAPAENDALLAVLGGLRG